MSATTLKAVSILVVEDEPMLRRQLAANLDRFGADVTLADSVSSSRRSLRDGQFDFVLLDINLPDGLGTDLLREKAFPDSTAVIVMTANGGVAGAVEAMRLGAADYLVKPFDPAELPLVIARVLRKRGKMPDWTNSTVTRRQNRLRPSFLAACLVRVEAQLGKILEADTRMQTLLPPVLIEGETGTGKTTFARWLHQRGPRGAQPFVEVNCSAVAESLAESELFGHERGAFTDAKSARIGLFEAASDGTLFLDELPSLSPAMQAKLLKVIEDNRLRRVGGTREIDVDTRIIAATNQNLKEMIAGGKIPGGFLQYPSTRPLSHPNSAPCATAAKMSFDSLNCCWKAFADGTVFRKNDCQQAAGGGSRLIHGLATFVNWRMNWNAPSSSRAERS